eukprot:CAMPEP_0197286224 /NCGR_PEP_ID=MMETSP0890-20130614/1690_1 /TAXON_ID=44058 ORGANISM="Aureoumbra lagunensis, Strain CCMP1510" /NCGR_SAMPLE_ID=MMETSP0890 /ASSEMBLY_ACC=CAM_ASM_000533 /LENGTH=385 /DNA_ID=CAMNT_0042754437 /DNA_START=122 /DNA_END=1279 /DNA_ORIENTATION=-
MEETNTWRSKYMVEIPRVLDPSEDHTRFEKYKSRYMGRYNQVDATKADISYEEFGAMVENQHYSFNVGDRVVGRVEKFDGPQRAMIEIGAKTFALLPLREATIAPISSGENIADFITIGEEYEFEIVSDTRDDGQVMLSLKRIAYEKAWEKLIELYTQDPVIEGTVVQVNRGGAIVLVEGLRAFCPGSHILGSAVATEALVGQPMQLKFLEVNRETSKLVVSQKRAVLEHAMEEIQRGNLVQGVVSAIKNYGAFIDLAQGSLSGLLHISQISYDRVTDIQSTLQEGMPIKCMVLDSDKSNGRIALSTKSLEPEPGMMLHDPQRVFDLAEDTAAKYHARLEAERIAREQAAQEMVLGLGDDLEALTSEQQSSGAIDNDLDVIENSP